MRPLPTWLRPFAIAAAVVFCVSLLFPVAAGLSKNTASFPPWWGALDVSLAFVLGAMAIVILMVGRGRVTHEVEAASYRVYRILIHVVLLLLVVFLIFGDQVVWINGLPGIAWRGWLAFYCIPEWMVALGNRTANP